MLAKTLFLKISVPTGPLVPSSMPAWFWAAVEGQRHQFGLESDIINFHYATAPGLETVGMRVGISAVPYTMS